MLRLLCLACLLPALAPSAQAARLAVLEFKNTSPLTTAEVRYLAERVRAVAQARSSDALMLMTRANLQALLPPGVDLAECEGECEIETGRAIGADFVVSGEVVTLGAGLRVVLNLHATAEGRQLAALHAGGTDVEALERDLVRTADRLFDALPGVRPTVQPAPAPTVAVPALPALPAAAVFLITSTPTGAVVSRNGEVLGTTPLRYAIDRPWQGTLSLALTGYVTAHRFVDLAPERSRSLEVELLPHRAPIRVSAVQPGGDACQGTLRIDGRVRGPLPWHGELDEGTYRLDAECGHRTAHQLIAWPSAQADVQLRAEDTRIELGGDLIGVGGWSLQYTGWFDNRAPGTLRVGLQLHGGRFPLNHVDTGYQEGAWHVGMQLRLALALSHSLDWMLDFTADTAWASCTEGASPSSDCARKDLADTFDLFPLIGGATGLRYDAGGFAVHGGVWLLRPFMYREPDATVTPYVGVSALF